MVGWLYIAGQVAAPVHVLDIDADTGIMGIEITGKFVSDHAALRGEVVVEYYGWKTRRQVRCLGAERIGTQLMIEAVDVSRAAPPTPPAPDPRGQAEDWLIVQGQAVCQVTGFTCGGAPQSATRALRPPGTLGHCMMHFSREAWRDLRVGEHAPLAAIGVTAPASPGSIVSGSLSHANNSTDSPGAITPLLQSTPLMQDTPTAEIKVVRLREREVLHITPLASDWLNESTLVVARVERVEEFGSARVDINANA